jgi:signal transduction histidine kinase
VAQEALTNVDRHAEAGHAEVVIEKLPDCILMKIHDDGKSFNVEHELAAGGSKRLGLLGMRERLEMIGGRLSVESLPGKGTTVEARIPPGNGRPQRKTPGPKHTKTKP